MVKQGFLNLEEKEKEKVFEAALDEFSRADFQSASLNRIIQMADISKGSMYHYFHNKEDLFLFVLDKAIKDKSEFLNQSLKELDRPLSEMDFFDKIRFLVRSAAAFADEYPLYNQMNLLLHGMQECPFKQRIWQRFNIGFDSFIENMVSEATQKGEIRSDLDQSFTVRILRFFLMRFDDVLSKQDYSRSNDSTQVNQELDNMIAFLRNGLEER